MQKPISKYEKDIEVEGKQLKAILTSYENPIFKSENVECFTRLEIADGDKLWGKLNYTNPIKDESEAEEIFAAIPKQPHIYQ